VVVCPVCGEENPTRARFCLNCGSALAPESVGGKEERKLISVLFCDLVGFTARSDEADPEDIRATLAPYHARLRSEIDRYGGTTEKFIGDAVMAVFGAPVAHEDDAERAVRAAFRIIESMEDLSAERADGSLAVRIGINTGEAVVAVGAHPERGEGLVTGDVVNTAARLQTVAPVDGVVVGEVTYRATKDLIQYEALDPVTVKGKAKPIPIWRAVQVRGRLGIDVEQGARTPFVGRDHELALLVQTFARAVDEPSIQLVTITGEPGVGKTRLLWEFRRHLDDRPERIYWRQGRCLPYGEGVTYWALGEMVKGQAGVLDSDPAEVVLSKLQTALSVVTEDEAERDWLVRRLAPLLGTRGYESDRDSRDEAFTAWVRFLEWIAARQPLVLVFEDLHWADGPLVEFVEHLVEWSSGVPMLVVCLARPELYERHPAWGGGQRNSTTISLSPLSGADTARLLSALLEQAVLPAEVQAELLEQAGGNPLYAEEFVRMLIDRDILQRHGPTLRITAGTGGIPMPESVQALIGARLDTLSAERKDLLRNAAVVGKVFWSGAVAAMASTDEQTVRTGLHDLSRKDLVRTMRVATVRDQVEYSFWHGLVRDVAYGQIPRAERAAKHLAVAEWIESAVGERMTDQAEFLAYHYERALELSAAAGRDAGEGLRKKAAEVFEMAGDRAQQLDVFKSLDFYRRAEALLRADDPSFPVLHVRTLTAAGEVGEATWTELADAYEAAIAHLRAQGDIVRAGDMLREYGANRGTAGSTEQADRINDEAIELLEPAGPSRELVAAYSARAGGHLHAGRYWELKTWTETTLELAERLGLDEYRMRALQYRGIYRTMAGDLDGRADLDEALRLGLHLGLGRETAIAFTNLADSVSDIDGPGAGLTLYQEGMAFAERRGIGGALMWQRAETTWRLFDLGRWDEILEAAEEIRRWFGGQSRWTQVSIAGTQEARVRAYRGELARAAELMEELLPAARWGGDFQAYRPALATAALIAFQSGRRDQAVELLDELHESLSGAGYGRAVGTLDGVLVARALGDADRAERFASVEEPFVPGYPVGKALIEASQAEVAEERGRYDDALAKFEHVESSWTTLNHVFHRGLALLGEARCLAALQRSGEASVPAREAQQIFLSLGARALAADAEALVPDATAASS
jgi:class 3 adenylate cyclase/tetratricopeptide (TPR) repeat protein